MKSRKLIKILIISNLFLFVTLLCCLLYTRVTPEYTVEAGQEIPAETFRNYGWDKGVFEWVKEPDTTVPGKQECQIHVFPITYDVTIYVNEPKDKEAPIVTTKNVNGYIGSEVRPEQFISEIIDDSECTVAFAEEPDTTVCGIQEVKLLVTDTVGYFTEVKAQLCIINLKEQLNVNPGYDFPEAEEFLVEKGSTISYITDIGTIDMTTEGTHEIRLLVDGMEAESVLKIVDTEAPKLILKSVEAWLNKPLRAVQFVKSMNDNSKTVYVKYESEPDWQLEGEQTVTIIATDAAGNSVSQTTILTINKNEKAPTITVTDIDVKVGGTVSYKKAVSYYDDIDSKEEMTLEIERSEVNLNEVGDYQVTYTVTDTSGNETSVTGKVNVLAEAPAWVDEDKIHEKAQSVLDSILTDGMTDREKAKAIYNWLKSNIGYISHSEKGNYTRGAYEGLFKKQGDCFVYAATAKELLTLAGIQNIDIVKATTNPSHYWNLVYIEDGWYHFDSTPRKDKSQFFLLTDAELEAYSSNHNNTHIFDRSLYPEIK